MCAHVCVCVCVCEHVCMHTCMRICVCDEMTTYPYAFGSASGSYKMGHHKQPIIFIIIKIQKGVMKPILRQTR